MVKTIMAPVELHEAALLKSQEKRSFFLAGGTFLNAGRKPAELNFISLHRLGLDGVDMKDGALHTGAMVTLGTLSDPPDLETHGLGALRDSCRAITRNVRNMATMGGAIAALYSRSDIAPVLLAAGASVVVMDAEGSTEMLPMEGYYSRREQGSSPLILKIIIPLPSPGLHLVSARFARTSMDLPIVKAAMRIAHRDGVTSDVRMAIGGLTEKVQRVPAIESFLAGKNLHEFEGGLKSPLEALIHDHVTAGDDLQGSGAFKKSVLLALIEDCVKESL